MPNLFDHVHDVGNQTISERPFDVLDSLALTQIVYMPLDGLLDAGASATLGEAWDYLQHTYPDGFNETFQRKRYDFTMLCANTPRYRDWVLHDYISIIDSERVVQFCACTFDLPGSGLSYIAFRGTDLTLVGWHEDLNMSFMTIPAQTESVNYLESIAAHTENTLMLGGHSKGGNLALYAAARCHEHTQSRICRVHSFDGPGMVDDPLESDSYERIYERVESYIPQSSVVGMLLHYHPAYTIVKSSAWGLWQHDALSWQISDGAFDTASELTLSVQYANEAMRGLLDEVPFDDRKLLIDTAFRVISAAEIEDAKVLLNTFPAHLPAMRVAVMQLEPETRAKVRHILQGLLASGAMEIIRMLTPQTLQSATFASLRKDVNAHQEPMSQTPPTEELVG